MFCLAKPQSCALLLGPGVESAPSILHSLNPRKGSLVLLCCQNRCPLFLLSQLRLDLLMASFVVEDKELEGRKSRVNGSKA